MLVNKDFKNPESDCVVARRPANQKESYKSLLTNMDFNMDFA